MHTLVLLDIQAHLDRYITANQALEYLLKAGKERKEKIITDDAGRGIGPGRAEKPEIRADKIGKLVGEDFGGPLHCLIIPSDLHFVEVKPCGVGWST